MSSIIDVVKGDTLPDLRFALVDGDTSLPIDLTDVSSAAMLVRMPGTITVLLTVPGAPENPFTGGYVRFVWPFGGLDSLAVGRYEGRITLYHVGGRVQTVARSANLNVLA
jgi:hypothetical protein